MFISVDKSNPLDDFWHAVCAVEFAPFILRRHHQLEGHSEACFTAQAAFGFACTVAHGGKGALNRVSGSDVFPVFGGKVVEGQEPLAIFGQFCDRLVVFDAVGLDKEIKGLTCVSLGLRLPDVVQMALGFGLD